MGVQGRQVGKAWEKLAGSSAATSAEWCMELRAWGQPARRRRGICCPKISAPTVLVTESATALVTGPVTTLVTALVTDLATVLVTNQSRGLSLNHSRLSCVR